MAEPLQLWTIVHPDGTRTGDGIFEVYPAQYRFLAGSQRRNQLFVGGRGAGKTHALMLKAIDLALANPGYYGVIGGRTFKEAGTRLKVYLDKSFEEFYEKTGVRLVDSYSKSLQRIRLCNGGAIWLKGYDQVDKIVGDDAAWYVLDELEHTAGNPTYVWDKLSPAVRVGHKLQMAASTTPNGIGGITGRFLRMQRIEADPDNHTEEQLKAARNYYAVRASMFENPWLRDEVKADIAGSVSRRMYRQEVLGLILSPDSSVFGVEFDIHRHVIPWRWDPTLPYILAIDWGTSHAYWCAIQIVDRHGVTCLGRTLLPGTWIVAYEQKLERTSYHAVREAIVKWVGRQRRGPILAAADRAVKTENAWLRHKLGIDVLTCDSAGEQRIVAGIELLRYMLDPYEDAEPRLLFSSVGLSTDVVEEEGRGILGALVNYENARDRNGVLTNKPLKDNVNDHPVDALRYAGVTTRFLGDLHGGEPLPYVWPS